MLTSLIYTRLSAALSSSASTNAPTNSPSDASADTSTNSPSTDTAFASSLLAGYARYTSAHALDRKAVLAQLASEDIFTTLKSTFLNEFCK
jgi:hypothetical protein